jgi:hypothetical protein
MTLLQVSFPFVSFLPSWIVLISFVESSAVTGKAKVSTASGHADWLQSQLHLKTPPCPVENGIDSGNKASHASGSVEATEEMPPLPCDGKLA